MEPHVVVNGGCVICDIRYSVLKLAKYVAIGTLPMAKKGWQDHVRSTPLGGLTLL